jgi:hypothetical protein
MLDFKTISKNSIRITYYTSRVKGHMLSFIVNIILDASDIYKSLTYITNNITES